MNQFSTFMVHGCRALIHFIRCKWLPAQIFSLSIRDAFELRREKKKKNQRISIIAHVVAKNLPSQKKAKFVVGKFMILAKNFALESQ